ncbi:unnamed protein product [Meloidogyne enterolobii]|uniref:Uncharacterized protein n=1 Tax=Meloidogyne enterolobii TaxID=390850 RepID=A0ACB1A6R1_MELEN
MLFWLFVLKCLFLECFCVFVVFLCLCFLSGKFFRNFNSNLCFISCIFSFRKIIYFFVFCFLIKFLYFLSGKFCLYFSFVIKFCLSLNYFIFPSPTTPIFANSIIFCCCSPIPEQL